jgi:hypothetical protein
MIQEAIGLGIGGSTDIHSALQRLHQRHIEAILEISQR